MRSLRFTLAAAFLFANAAIASPTVPKDGVEYATLATPQPVTAVGKKVEVIEFFMYHCPHCNAFEPDLEKWVKKQGDKITFRRVHFPSRGANDPEAHLFLTLEAMGKSEEMQPKVFKAFHVDHIRLTQDDAIIDWVGKNGIDRNKFMNMWGSFGVTAKLRGLPQVIDNYKVQFVPTIVIDGKYQTSPSMAQESLQSTNEPQIFGATLQIMDALVAKAAAAKK
jgi:thiol:disulfide interchange protein DsbA